MAGDDDFVVQVNTLHGAHVEGGAWAQIANRGHRVEEADIAGDHLGQHRLKDAIVLLMHEGNLDEVVFQTDFRHDFELVALSN